MQLNKIAETLSVIAGEMLNLASQLPEYSIVMAMCGIGEILGSQLIAEIGDVRRFQRKQSLVAFAEIDAPHLRKALFQVMSCLLKNAPANDAVFQYLDKKRAEDKHCYVYILAAANKFLRIYYARIEEHLNNLEY